VQWLALKVEIYVLLHGNMNCTYPDVGCQLVLALRSPGEALLRFDGQSGEGAGRRYMKACWFV
jgi:hypothetical protein